ncbi:MAG: CinA family nicotinamide mononucleotide deamidase-related protein [Flavisolibacter sp.]|nr:CinA family nicotinamide mononucleotide deamidase-related protein [Flavisolibacter sp.]
MAEINASIITIGDELLIGQTIDTNSAYIAQELNKIGIWVKRRVAVGDVREEILKALQEQSRDCQLIIITGGLGPTADDITKPSLCGYFNTQLVTNEEALENVRSIFTRMNRPLTERNIKQAEVPDGCTVLQNKRGTAPGMWFEKDSVVYISLPGVPHEMTGLMEHSVLPTLKSHFTLPAVIHKTAVTVGQGESFIADRLIAFEATLPQHIKLAYLPMYGMVRLRLTGKGAYAALLEKEMENHFQKLQILVQEWLVADEDKSLLEVVAQLLEEKKKSVVTAESCTGGYIAHLFTSRAGASLTFRGGVVGYANEVKEQTLHVQRNTFERYGAVSEETVVEMVQGALEVMHADYAVATSGIMGPDGGTKDKPVGTVWIAVASKRNIQAVKHFVRFDRKRNIELTAQLALNMLRRLILAEEKQ